MANDNDKKWNRPWSMEEMIENAESWSMAGDVALLNTIKAYADTLLTKTFTISNNVDDLLNDLSEVGLKLDISQNEFQSLRNTQFIESRVYEDDETVDVKENIKEEEKVFSEEEKREMIRESILEGLQVMDKYFDKIEVSISDSEEESDKSYVLQPKDFYADRPLPLIIGTDEWFKKWHVGLAESSSESDSDKNSETYSDSDSEDALPKDLLKGSETSSELDYSGQPSENRPVANSTFNDSSKQPDTFESDESDEPGSLPAKTPISNKNFVDQLAEKLGNVISEREDISTEVNTKPIQPVQTNKFVGDLFSDEPPPLDDVEDTILPKNAQSGLFSGGQGLFNDKEEDSFWGQHNTVPKVDPEENKVITKQESAPQSLNKNVTLLPKSSQVSKGLFDSDDSSDEDIFVSNRKQLSKPPFLQPYKAVPPLFEEEPPELDLEQKKSAEEISKKKPVGGVSVFGPSDVFKDQKIENALKNRLQNVTKEGQTVEEHDVSNTSNGEEARPKKLSLFDDDVDSEILTPPRNIETNTKKISLFDDDDDLFKDGLFSNVSSKKPVLDLFDVQKYIEDIPTTSTDNNRPKVDPFSSLGSEMTLGEKKADLKSNEKNPDKIKRVISLFSDNEDDDIFEQKLNVPKKIDDDTRNLVDDIDSVGEEQNQNINKISEKLPEGQVVGIEEEPKQKEISKGLLEKYHDENDSETLFKAGNVKPVPNNSNIMEDLSESHTHRSVGISPPKVDSEYTPQPPQLQVTNPTLPALSVTRKTEEKKISLFGSSPPPDDDDWDTKSDHFSDTEDQFSYRIDNNAGRSSLFDNEPPSLGPNESSGIVRDQNVTRVESDDSSFYPYASSSRRLSSDIFNEQQSQDSFFITKNKTESVNVPPQLDIIEEDKKSSNLSITPSGRVEDLEDSKENSTNSIFNHNFLETENLPKNPRKPLSFLNDANKDDEDLFSFRTETKSLPKLSEKRLTLFDNVEDILEEKKLENEYSMFEADSSQNSRKLGEGEGIAGISPKQENIKMEFENTSQQPQSNLDKEIPGAGSFGKLKHSLNINVNALLPGSTPPKLKDLSKSQSLDLPKEDEISSTSISTPNVSFLTPDISKRLKKSSDTHLEKAVSFEDALDNVEVLHSVTKDRARIPIKRRPSTRRGRREAIHKVTTDASVEYDGNIDSTPAKSTEIKSKMELNEPMAEADYSTKGLKLITPSEGEPIFQPAYTNVENTQVKSTSKDNADSSGLFSDSSEKSIKPSEGDKPKLSIFDSGDSDSDLFGPSEVKKPKQGNNTKSKPTDMTKSLFNDSSSDDDLFSATSNNDGKKKEQPRPSEKKMQKPSTLRRLQNIETDDDPLSSLLR